MTDTLPVRVIRSSKGLVDALFDSIDRLNSGQVTPEAARALSHTAKTIVNVARLEMDYRKMAESNAAGLKSLTIDGAAENVGNPA